MRPRNRLLRESARQLQLVVSKSLTSRSSFGIVRVWVVCIIAIPGAKQRKSFAQVVSVSVSSNGAGNSVRRTTRLPEQTADLEIPDPRTLQILTGLGARATVTIRYPLARRMRIALQSRRVVASTDELCGSDPVLTTPIHTMLGRVWPTATPTVPRQASTNIRGLIPRIPGKVDILRNRSNSIRGSVGSPVHVDKKLDGRFSQQLTAAWLEARADHLIGAFGKRFAVWHITDRAAA